VLTAFTAGLLLITVSELGDKTFFIAMLLAMRHSRRFVFLGVVAALAAMTVLSVLLGQSVSFLPQIYVRWGEVVLFTGFGIKLLLDAKRMPKIGCNPDEEKEAAAVVAQAEAKLPKHQTLLAIVMQSFVLTFLAEWGDRTQIATIVLAASNNPFGVTAGATIGHSVCAAIAVLCGRLICGRISERTITQLGGGLFLVFAGVALIELFQ
jgi:Ca2+/H+ antiporter, TMEM165/GDT1 family